MAVQTLSTLKNWFVTGAKPLQSQFWDWLDSFIHKNDPIPMSQVSGLNTQLTGLATTAYVDAAVAAAGGAIPPVDMEVNSGSERTYVHSAGVLLEKLYCDGACTLTIGTGTGGDDVLRVEVDAAQVVEINRYTAANQTLYFNSTSTVNLHIWLR